MKLNKKLITMLAALGLVGCVGVGSTLAYLTDTKEVTNTFTVGNVSIELIESQLHRSNAGVVDEKTNSWQGDLDSAWKLKDANEYANKHNWKYKFFEDATIKEDAKGYKDNYFTPKATKMVPGYAIRKCPYIINTGDVDAYVRARVLVPAEFESHKGIVSSTYTAWTHGEIIFNGVKYDGKDENYEVWYGAEANRKPVTRDGKDYYEYSYVYTQPLAPGEMTFWNCIGGVAISGKATADDIAAFVDDDRAFDIIVEADAIQAKNFTTAEAAFSAFDIEKEELEAAKKNQ